MTESGHAPHTRTPLFNAQHSERYARQDLVRKYQELTGANLIVMIDQIFADNMTSSKSCCILSTHQGPYTYFWLPPVATARLLSALSGHCRHGARS